MPFIPSWFQVLQVDNICSLQVFDQRERLERRGNLFARAAVRWLVAVLVTKWCWCWCWWWWLWWWWWWFNNDDNNMLFLLNASRHESPFTASTQASRYNNENAKYKKNHWTKMQTEPTMPPFWKLERLKPPFEKDTFALFKELLRSWFMELS